MLHFHLKLPAGGAAVLLAFLLTSSAAQGASLPRYHSRLFHGGGGLDAEPGRPAAYAPPPPSSDLMKALEYIESLKQKNGANNKEAPPVDYDEVDKIRVLLQLASLQDEGGAAAGGRQSPPPPPPPPAAAAAQRQQHEDLPAAEQLVKVLLKSLQDQAGMRDSTNNKAASAAAAPAPPPPAGSNRHRHRTEGAAGGPSAPAGGDYGNFPRPHKKYPLMFEDEENNRDAFRRATEDLDEQYTPQSLANLRSIFDELGRMPTTTNGEKRNDDDGEEDEDILSLRNLAYEDVAGGEEDDSWVPVEERMETEELVNGSHDEYERGLAEGDLMEGAEREEMQRRASQNDDDDEADDDTKLVDYYLLKVLEMSDQTQKRDAEQRKRLIRPSLVDPRTVKELLELSLKLHVPPQDLIDLLLTDELRKLHRHPQVTATTAHFRTGQTPKFRYYSRRLPVVKSKAAAPVAAPDDMDREDFLDIIGVETISNEYPVRQRPLKTAASPARAPPSVPSAPAAVPALKVPPPSGHRENLFLSELNKMPLKRQADGGDDDDDDVEDEVTTYLAAKILTEYPQSGIAKRDTTSKAQFPYELYEQAMKDFLDQADTGGNNKGKVAKRETESAPPIEEEEAVEPTEAHGSEAAQPLETAAPQTTADGEEQEHRGKQIAGM